MKNTYPIKIAHFEVEYSLLARLHCLLGLNSIKFQSGIFQTARRQFDEDYT